MRTSSLFALICGFGLPLAGCASSASSAVLTSQTSPSAECKWSANATDWSLLRTIPTEFGVDDIRVRGDHPVVVDSVELINATGIKLTGVFLSTAAASAREGNTATAHCSQRLFRPTPHEEVSWWNFAAQVSDFRRRRHAPS